MNGFTPVIISLEMSEDAFAQRIDAGLSGLDINKIYDTKKKELVSSIKNQASQRKGDLFIKQFPTGGATVNDIKSYLHELTIRGYKPGPIYVDYLNILKPTYLEKDSNLYTRNKRISEELRALSFEYETPVISAIQLTTEGMQIAVNELNY
jgi:replicative DNA helicase